jgi:5-methylcytosine-specific restriction endonuclease McrA
MSSIELNNYEEEKRIKQLYTHKKSIGLISEKKWKKNKFIEWYKKEEKNGCAYCGLTKKELDIISKKDLLHSARSPKRGKSFEVDRKNPKKGYVESNCCLACYWCNNAKSDIFTFDEFKPIGKAMVKIIRDKRIKNLK